MSVIEVFDPPMCCSTGVCGPRVDPALAAFASDLGELAARGVSVTRHNLSQEPAAFAEDELVRGLLHEHGDEVLPVIKVNGELRSSGRYPSREQLESWTLGDAETSLDARTAELVALGAAIGANCESCLKYHYNQARLLGVSSATMVAAARVAQTVKDAPAASMLALAAKLLETTPESLGATATGATTASDAGPSPDDSACCSPATDLEVASSSDEDCGCGDGGCASPSSESLSIGANPKSESCCG